MKVYLTKQHRKTIDFVLLEADDKFVRKSAGKIGKSGIANSTLNAGSPANAIAEIKKETSELTDKGFVISELPNNLITKDIVFDKAKWHINEKFPSDLDQYQSYVHTGLYVCWLLDNNFYEADFIVENNEAVQKLLNRQVNPSKFYEEQLDGVFDAEGLTPEAKKFTAHYFNFEKGQYLNDYFSILDPDDKLPSMFHITDTWGNYDKLKPILNDRFAEWKRTE